MFVQYLFVNLVFMEYSTICKLPSCSSKGPVLDLSPALALAPAIALALHRAPAFAIACVLAHVEHGGELVLRLVRLAVDEQQPPRLSVRQDVQPLGLGDGILEVVRHLGPRDAKICESFAEGCMRHDGMALCIFASLRLISLSSTLTSATDSGGGNASLASGSSKERRVIDPSVAATEDIVVSATQRQVSRPCSMRCRDPDAAFEPEAPSMKVQYVDIFDGLDLQ